MERVATHNFMDTRIKDKELLERPVFFTYCNINTRKVRVPGGGFIFTATYGYRHSCHAENQQCTLFHKNMLKNEIVPQR